MLTGAEIILACLKEQGVEVVFGYPGGAVIHIYDALYQSKLGIRHILTAHEQGAAHAADGYARATGKVGVCLATSGPGATNLVTGIATAFMDSVPLVAITGNVPVALLGKDSFQEVDITGITMPITKHNFIVRDIKDLAHTIRRAFQIAQSGRPGPVLIDIPKDITVKTFDYEATVPYEFEAYDAGKRGLDVESAIALIRQSKRPMVFCGGGVISANASHLLFEFVKKLQAPVACSLMGLGAFPTDHPLYAGMIGMHGSKASNQMTTECDLLIAIGARFSDRVISKVEGFAPGAQILHIDIDPAEINKNIKTYQALVGPIGEVLKALTQGIDTSERNKWLETLSALKAQFPVSEEMIEAVTPYEIIKTMQAVAGEDVIVVTEVGQNQMWAAQYSEHKHPRTFISSGGLGTMGFGLGAAMGAQIGQPDKTVVLVAGDGSFHMNCNELSTAVKYGISVKIILLNNGVLGMVRQWQSLFCDKRFSETTLSHPTNIVKLAEAFGAKGFEIRERSEIHATLKKAFSENGPVVVNCTINSDEMVFPMVPPGAVIKDLMFKEAVYEK